MIKFLNRISEWFREFFYIRPQMDEDPRMKEYDDYLVNRFMRNDDHEHFIYNEAKDAKFNK